MDAVTEQTFAQFREQILLYIERQKTEIISDYEDKEPEAATAQKERMNAVAEELRKINRANIEATLALEEQKALNAARKDMHQQTMKCLRRSYDGQVKDIHDKLAEINIYNHRMQKVITALQKKLYDTNVL